jgi:AcrR family transcriptional regulator
MSGRRSQLRTSLEQAIFDAALAELRRVGPSALSLREVARGANISPSGLYRYVEGRDGLLELLISDGFHRFGDAVSSAISAADDSFASKVQAIAHSYRRWAKDNPEQFALILGSPVVGFHPDPSGPTNTAARRFGMPMLALFAHAHRSQVLDPVATADSESFDLSAFDTTIGVVPASVIDLAMRGWARIHGIVILEAFGHLAWTGRDVATLLDAEAESIAKSFTTRTPTKGPKGK